MGLDIGETVYFRLMPETATYSATIVSVNEDNIVLSFTNDSQISVSEGKYLIIVDVDGNYYTKVTGVDRDTISIRKMWRERREYFRVDDVLPVGIKKVDKDKSYLKSKIFSGYNPNLFDNEMPDETISPQLWRILVDINSKLGLIFEKLCLESEGFLKFENSRVNLSATGICCTTKEKVEEGDDVEIKILLPTIPPTGILTYGNAVRAVKCGGDEYEVSLHFIDMDNDVRDEIIQYSLNRQREVIRMRRQQSGNDT